MRSHLSFWIDRVLGKQRRPATRKKPARKLNLEIESLERRETPTAGLVAAYNFNQGSGTVLTDVSGNGNTGLLNNATWVAGKYGDGLQFTGAVNSYVSIADAPALDMTNALTLEAWIDPSSLNSPDAGWCAAVAKDHPNSINDISCSLYAAAGTNTPPAEHLLVGNSDVGVSANSPLPLNHWAHLAATYDGATMKIYVNGVLVSSRAQSGSIVEVNAPLKIGGDWSGEMFTGVIDDVRVYNVALTQAQIQSDMNTPVGTTGSLTASAGPNLSGNEGSSFSFSGSAGGGTGTLTSGWTFGDGGTASGTLTPSHTYASDGSYTATLTITDSTGATAKSSTTVTVKNVAPTVTSGGPYSGMAGTAIAFTGTATVPDHADTLTYLWSFGDGTTSALLAQAHTYTTAGIYTVSLKVTDSEGASTTASTSATVSGPLVVSAGTGASGNEGSAIPLHGTAAGGTGTLTYAWAFGDGGTATGTLTPSHVYVSDGSYTAKLTVTDAAGHTASASTAVTVKNVAPAVTSGGPYTGVTGTAIALTGTASVPDPADTLSYLWTFGDGATSTVLAPAHAYSTAGTYTVTLKVTDSEGASTTAGTTATVSAVASSSFPNNLNPPPLPPPTGAVVNVSTVSQLQTAVANLQSGQTIVIAPGTYNLTASLYVGLNSHVTNVAIRGATNKNSDVVLLGAGMDNNSIGMGISVWNAQNVTIADLSIGNVYFDDIELKGDQGADRITVYNCHLFDSGEQIVKSDPNTTGGGVTNSSVQYCTIGYTTAPSTVDHGGGTGYTQGVDVHGGSNWLVSDNLFQNFHTPDGSANLWNPTVLFWNHSANDTVTANAFVNCDRAIAFGLIEQTSGFDNQGGLIANNFVYMAPGEYSAARQAGADAPVIAWDSPGTTIAFNTIMTNGNTPNSIQARFVETTNVSIQDNLAGTPVRSRDNATYTASGNYTSATSSMFVNPSIGDLHLVANAATQANVIGKAASLASVTTDYDGQIRTNPTDIGADQLTNVPSSLTLSPTTLSAATVGTAYSATLTASGGSGSYTFAVTSGSLPAWLSLNANTGVLSGTPNATGSSSFTITATDAKNGAWTGSHAYTLTVNPAAALTVNPATLPSATANTTYSATLGGTGGSGTYTFAVTTGSLPSWLSLNASTGVLSGTPTTTGSSSFTITATDSNNASLKGSRAYTLTVNPASTQEPLLYQANVQYVGAFRVPAVADPLQAGSYTYSYGGTALAFNSANHSLFLVGMPYDQAVSEISIPNSIVNSTNLSNLATASVLQAPVPVLSKIPSQITPDGGTLAVGGLTVDNGQLIGTEYDTYDAGGIHVLSHFVLSSLNLSTATVSGLYQVGTLGAGLVAGYMAPIPTEWQAALGDPYITGQADISIVSRTSSGPAAFGFNPSQLGSGVAPDMPYVYYPYTNPLGPYEGPADPLQSGNSHVNGAVFVPGTSSVLFFGTTGTNYNGYGEPSDYGDTVDTAKGPHSLNGQYALQVWAYNANDLVKVKNGTLQPDQVMPYDVWNFTLPSPAGNFGSIGGVAFDPSTGRLYMSVIDVDNQAAYTDLPLIEVFQLSTTPISGPTPPKIGTLAGTTTEAAPSGSTSALMPGPIPAGTPVVLTAGNVYAITNGAGITQVAFYLDSNNNGVLDSGDHLFGLGTAAKNLPSGGSSNWTLTISTTGMAPGTYTLFAQATDSNGLLSVPIAVTLTVQ